MKKRLFLIFAAVFILIYLFWGPLFAWSPVKIGYKKVGTDRYTLFIKEKIPTVDRLDTILKAEEGWHGCP